MNIHHLLAQNNRKSVFLGNYSKRLNATVVIMDTYALLQSVSRRLKVQGKDPHMHFHENINVELSLEQNML